MRSSKEIANASDEILLNTINECLQCDNEDHLDNTSEVQLNRFVLDNASTTEGRLELPAIWNNSVIHRLPNNYALAHSVLKTTIRKYQKEPSKLEQYDNCIKLQLEQGIIEEVNAQDVCSKPEISYLAHNAVFKENAASTKCRVVFLSNICDKKNKANLSHNQVSLPGCQLNNKLLITATLYRFNKYLFIYDLEKAFVQLCLKPEDTEKLHFLWFKDVTKGDKSIVTYRFKRVPFGLRFSPYLLMMALFIILVLCVAICEPREMSIRAMMYNMAYMDNLGFSSSDKTEMVQAYKSSNAIFDGYNIKLQQYATNCQELNSFFVNDNDNDDTNLFGINWNKSFDSYSVKNCEVSVEANTKRLILASLNSVFDPLGILLPTLNRAKLFLNKLHSLGHLKWDTKLDVPLQREWTKIAKQINSSSKLSIPRYMGDYCSKFKLLVFTDASINFYGTVIYLQDCATNKISFLMSKNRMIPKGNTKSIPVLELLGVSFGVEVGHKLKNELSNAYCPLNIIGVDVYTDSMIALNWLSSKATKFSKIERKGVVINNALNKIVAATNSCPMSFFQVEGSANPADFVTRGTSAFLLAKSNFYTGPVNDTCIKMFSIPCDEENSFSISSYTVQTEVIECDIIPYEKFTSFRKLCRVMHFVRKYLFNLKERVKRRKPHLFPKLSHADATYRESVCCILRISQSVHYASVVQCFSNPSNLPNPLISQLNIAMEKGILRVKGKCRNLIISKGHKYPILLHKNSKLTALIINDYHHTLGHPGIHKVLSLLREQFWIPSGYMSVKKAVRKCIPCKKLFGRAVKINQNDYRSFRINPSKFPFRDIALDYISFNIRGDSNVKQKVNVLIITCLFTRAINLIVCEKADNECFLEAFQGHIYEYGIPQFILSDNGSQLVGSIQLIQNFLDDVEVRNFLEERNIKKLHFTPYPSGASYLGGVVESLVKQVKNMIYCSLGKKLLTFRKFCLFIKECKMLINKRPVAFKNLLTSPNNDQDAPHLTPEVLIHGYEVPAISIIPYLHADGIDDTFCPDLTRSERQMYNSFNELRRVKNNLADVYTCEFLDNLRYQSVNAQKRYTKRTHQRLALGDMVSIKTKFMKPYDFPCGIVIDIEENDLGEVVHVTIRKANHETIRRHVSDVIFLQHSNSQNTGVKDCPVGVQPIAGRQQRDAAKKCDAKIASLRMSGDI